MTLAPEMKTTAIASWFGCNRLYRERVGLELGKLEWAGVPCMGAGPELPHIQTRAGIASDLHRHIINLARVIADPVLHARLVEMLQTRLFHPDEFAAAQHRCIAREAESTKSLFLPQRISPDPDVAWAADYFIASWMGRGGHAGKKTEFTQGLAVRWTSSGGDSARRFQSAIDSLPAWHRALSVWSFELLDVFDFLPRARDQRGHGYYFDPPWPDAGYEYKHNFTEKDQSKLALHLAAFRQSRLVIRYNDHPFVRELYPESRWTWIRQTSRNQQNNDCQEVLILNGPSYVEKP